MRGLGRFLMFVPMLLGYTIMIALIPFGLVYFLAGSVIAQLLATFGATLMRPIASLLANRFFWLGIRPTSTKRRWIYSGSFNAKFKVKPEESKFLPNFVRPDGTGIGAYLTVLVPYQNTTRHPWYNSPNPGVVPGAPMKKMYAIHPYPFANQFTEGPATVYYDGFAAKTTRFAWGNFNEIMPGKRFFEGEPQEAYRGKLNHVPHVDLNLFQCPVYYVSDSSGMRAIIEDESKSAQTREAVKRRMAVAATKSGQTYVCLLEDCGKELSNPDADGISVCPAGHRWKNVGKQKYTTQQKQAMR